MKYHIPPQTGAWPNPQLPVVMYSRGLPEHVTTCLWTSGHLSFKWILVHYNLNFGLWPGFDAFRPTTHQHYTSLHKGAHLVKYIHVQIWTDSHIKLYGFIWKGLILPDNYHLSLPTAAPPYVWAVNWVGYMNVIKKPTESDNQQLPHKIMTIYYTYFLLNNKTYDSTYMASLKVIAKVVIHCRPVYFILMIHTVQLLQQSVLQATWCMNSWNKEQACVPWAVTITATFYLSAYLKVISKWPTSKHFKECMMIAICTNNIQIIVLSSDSYTFLAVGSTKTRRSSTPQKHTFELQGKACLYSRVTSCNLSQPNYRTCRSVGKAWQFRVK